MKGRIIRDIKTFFEQEEYYYKHARAGDFWNINYTECESNWDRNKTLSIKEYLDKTKPHLKDISKTVTHRKFN